MGRNFWSVPKRVVWREIEVKGHTSDFKAFMRQLVTIILFGEKSGGVRSKRPSPTRASVGRSEGAHVGSGKGAEGKKTITI